MAIPNRITALFQNLSGKEGAVEGVAQRFLFAFQEHGVQVAQIPRLIPKIGLEALQTPQTLLPSLTPDILDQTARLFGIRTQWLEGVDDRIYEYLAYYKRSARILEVLSEALVNADQGEGFPLRVLTSESPLDRNTRNGGYLAPVVLEKITTLGEEDIYRYRVFQDGISWQHLPCRIEVKAVARVVFKALHVPVPLFVISDADMNEVLEGRMVPRRFFDRCLITDPSLEDYALSGQEGRAKEEDELPKVLRYIEEHHLDAFPLGAIPVSTAKPDTVTTAGTPAESSAPDPCPDREDENGAVSGMTWQDVARAIADELHSIDVQCGAYGSLRDLSDRVAAKMRERKIYGPRGPLSGGTILRDALQGGKWKRKR